MQNKNPMAVTYYGEARTDSVSAPSGQIGAPVSNLRYNDAFIKRHSK